MVSQGKAKHSELQNKVDILTAQHANEEKNPNQLMQLKEVDKTKNFISNKKVVTITLK